MDLSRINIQPRIRNTWEAIDLGFIMARSWWSVLYISWLVPALLVYIPLSIIFYEDNWLAIMLTWWLKPLFDRAPLFIASRKLFSEDVTIKETFKKLPSLYKTDMFAWLLWRRFSFTRSFDMPVTVLESLKGVQRTRRLLTLHQNTSSAASWLTIVCVHLEAVIWLGLLGFFMLLIPEEIDINLMDVIVDEGMLAQLVSSSVQFFAMTVIAPFYTMAGFALYINRRINLEAWDLEIRFRHLAETRAAKLATSVSAVLLACMLVFSSMPNDALASEYQSLNPEQSQQLIQQVLEGEDFHNQVVDKGWRLKKFDDNEEDVEGVPDWLISFIKFLESVFGDWEPGEKNESDFSIAAAVEFVLWVLLALVILYLAYRILVFYDVIVPKHKRQDLDLAPPPDILFGLDVRKDSIPHDVSGQTLALWNAGQHREAIGLLYRSTLSLLIHRFSFRFYDGHTEQECARIVEQSGKSNLSQYVSAVTRSWQQVAYAHQSPADQAIQLLCRQWNEVSANAE